MTAIAPIYPWQRLLMVGQLQESIEFKLHYKVTPNDEGVMLCIWEPAETSEDRVRPFLYMVKHQLHSADKVPEVLQHYMNPHPRR